MFGLFLFQIILLLLMLFMRKRVALTIALFHVAGKVFIHLPLLTLQPFVTFLALLLFWIYWILVLLFLGTTGQSEPSGVTDIATFHGSFLQKMHWFSNFLSIFRADEVKQQRSEGQKTLTLFRQRHYSNCAGETVCPLLVSRLNCSYLHAPAVLHLHRSPTLNLCYLFVLCFNFMSCSVPSGSWSVWSQQETRFRMRRQG